MCITPDPFAKGSFSNNAFLWGNLHVNEKRSMGEAKNSGEVRMQQMCNAVSYKAY